MKRFSTPRQALTQVFAITLIISACSARVAPQTTPTINPIDLQVTAVAAAFTVVAETQAAISTAMPPLPTLAPTNTLPALVTSTPRPTLNVTFTPTSTVNPYAGDPCINQVLPASLIGEKIRIRIDNPTKGTINVSVYLQSGNPQGVCGYRGYILTAGQSLVITDLVEGCYSLWAWNPDPKNYFMVTNGTSCLNNSASWTFDISPNGINLR